MSNTQITINSRKNNNFCLETYLYVFNAYLLNSKLCWWYFGSFPIISKASPIAYALKSPPANKQHPIIHVYVGIFGVKKVKKKSNKNNLKTHQAQGLRIECINNYLNKMHQFGF